MSKQRDYNHQFVQRAGKKRDLFVCQICGSTVKPEGHHVINFQYGGAADIDNIITLCQKCHKSVHRGTIDIIKI